MRKHSIITALLVAVAFTLGSIGVASATGLIHNRDMATGSVNSRVINNGSVHNSDLTGHLSTLIHKKSTVPGPRGATGPAGPSGLEGAVYRVEVYNNGGGGSATVACADDEATSKKYTAIAGGVQGSTVGSQSPDGFAVSSSFPGRMDWNTNTPKPDRLDGWIVLGNGNYTSTLRVWALCVPTTDIPVQTVPLDN
jgi:hypothetical protein